MKFRLLSLFGISVLSLVSCIEEPTPYDIINLDQEFEISLTQAGSPSGMQLIFHVESIETFSCEDAEILTDFSATDAFLNLNIQGIDVPANCEDESSIIHTSIPLSATLEEYDCVLQVSQLKENIGQLIVSDNYYTLELESNHGIRLATSRIRKIPNGYCWGFITYDHNTNSTLSDSSIRNLVNNYSSPSSLPADDYGLFVINQDRSVNLKDHAQGIGFVFPYLDEDDTKSFFSSLELDNTSLVVNGFFDNGSIYLK